MPQIKLNTITCNDQQEEGHGTDEIYFVLKDASGNNATYWSNTMKGLSEDPSARYHFVHPSEKYGFDYAVEVEVWEWDADQTGHPNPDELLVKYTVFENGHGRMDYKLPGADYHVDWSIL